MISYELGMGILWIHVHLRIDTHFADIHGFMNVAISLQLTTIISTF